VLRCAADEVANSTVHPLTILVCSISLACLFCGQQEKHVLERYELRDLFQSIVVGVGTDNATASQWKILHDQVALDSDHGRTMIHFVAVKL